MASRPTTTRPSPERILAFIEGSPVSRGIEDVIDCIMSYADCREAISFVVFATAVQQADAARIKTVRNGCCSDMAWRRISSIITKRTRLAERVASEGIDSFAAESCENALVFKSNPGSPSKLAWRAEIILPPVNTLDAPLEVRVFDGSGKFVADGMFTICGASVVIEEGRGHLQRKALVDGLAIGGVSFSAKGGEPVSGTPVFGSLE